MFARRRTATVRNYEGICRDCGSEWGLPEDWVLEKPVALRWRRFARHRGAETAAKRGGGQCPECGSTNSEVRPRETA